MAGHEEQKSDGFPHDSSGGVSERNSPTKQGNKPPAEVVSRQSMGKGLGGKMRTSPKVEGKPNPENF